MTRQEELAGFLAVANDLASLLEPLDEDRLNRVPFGGSWTAGQLGDHLLKSFRLLDLPKVGTAPARRPLEEKSARIDAVFLDFTTKYQPPEPIVPSTEKIAKRNLVDDLRKAADGIAVFVNGHELSFTSPEFELIGFGDLTAQEWIHFLTVHGKRHVRQLRNILVSL